MPNKSITPKNLLKLSDDIWFLSTDIGMSVIFNNSSDHRIEPISDLESLSYVSHWLIHTKLNNQINFKQHQGYTEALHAADTLLTLSLIKSTSDTKGIISSIKPGLVYLIKVISDILHTSEDTK